MKTAIGKILIILTVLLLSVPAYAANEPIIADDANLLTAEEEQSLYSVMQQLSEYGTPMFWTTRESGNDQTLVENFYRSQIGRDSGTLFVINMNSRLLTVFSDGEIYRTITSSEASTITDNVYRYASAGEYYECARNVFAQIGRLLRGERIARPMRLISSLLLAVTLALLIVYLYISWRYEQHRNTAKIKAAVPVSVLAGTAFTAKVIESRKKMTRQVKTNLSDSGSGGHGGHGGFGGGGGFSGGGHSGGGGSHRF